MKGLRPRARRGLAEAALRVLLIVTEIGTIALKARCRIVSQSLQVRAGHNYRKYSALLAVIDRDRAAQPMPDLIAFTHQLWSNGWLRRCCQIFFQLLGTRGAEDHAINVSLLQ